MSGICGVIHFDGRPGVSEALATMTAAAAHRGPDGIRRWTKGGVGLAHMALHVTPEDERETQPLVDDPLVLVADARIDNRSDLKSSLRPFFRTAAPTDAEFILAAYRRWGTDCAQHLIGDFAFAIWDDRERRLFAARDPMGMRALYYRAEPQRFFIATEVKQILAVSGVPTRIYDPMVAAYLQGDAGDAPWTTWTFYEGIRQVSPAHAIVVHDGRHRTWEYWDLELSSPIRYDSDQEYIEHFQTLYVEAVRCRLRGRRPVCALLSGGVDSGSNVSVAARLLADSGRAAEAPSIQPISWAFPTLPECDERFISDRIVDHFGLQSTELNVEDISLIGTGPYQQLDADEPYAEAYYALLNASFDAAQKQGARVLLSGFRGDFVTGEWLFDYEGMFRRGEWLTLWNDLQTNSTQNGGSLPALINYHFRPSLRSVWPKDWAPGLRSAIRNVWRWVVPPRVEASTTPDWIGSRLRSLSLSQTSSSPASRERRATTQDLRYEGLRLPRAARAASWLDRVGARYGVSHADPWSDRRLAQFAVSVPPRMICRAGTNKYIAREAMQGWIPDTALQKVRKVYPKALHDRALKEQDAESVEHLLTGGQAERLGYVREETLRAYYDEYLLGGKEDPRFWHTLLFEKWLREYHM